MAGESESLFCFHSFSLCLFIRFFTICFQFTLFIHDLFARRLGGSTNGGGSKGGETTDTAQVTTEDMTVENRDEVLSRMMVLVILVTTKVPIFHRRRWEQELTQ